MPSRKLIDRFLEQKHIAVVGVSRNSKKFPNAVYRQLDARERVVYPVNADADTVEGVRAYRHLADVPDPLDGVMIVLGAEAAKQVVGEAVARGVPRIWLHRGVGPSTVSPEAVAMCRDNNIEVIDGACPFMFDEPVRSVHRLHRVLTRNRPDA